MTMPLHTYTRIQMSTCTLSLHSVAVILSVRFLFSLAGLYMSPVVRLKKTVSRACILMQWGALGRLSSFTAGICNCLRRELMSAYSCGMCFVVVVVLLLMHGGFKALRMESMHVLLTTNGCRLL